MPQRACLVEKGTKTATNRRQVGCEVLERTEAAEGDTFSCNGDVDNEADEAAIAELREQRRLGGHQVAQRGE